MFDIDIPEVDKYDRSAEDILKHVAEAVSIHKSLPTAKVVKEAADIVTAFANKKISYSDALNNIYEIGDGLGMQGVCLGSLAVDLQDLREIIC